MSLFVLFFGLLEACFSRTLTPSEMAALAEARAPMIKLQIESKNAASGQVLQSELLANPMLSLQTGALKSGGQTGGVVDLTLSQPLPWPGKRAAEITSSQILEKIATVDLEESKILVNHTVSLLSIELAALVELEKHNAERKRRFSIINRFLSTRPMASPKQVLEKNLIDSQIRLVENSMYGIETRKSSIARQLEVLVGESNLSVQMKWNGLAAPESEENFVRRLENSPRLQRSQKHHELAMNKVERVRYLARPDIVLGLNYRQENVEPANHFYHLNLSIVLPLLDRGQYSLEVARANARMEEANKQMTLESSIAALNQSYQALLAAYKGTELFRISDLNAAEKRFTEAEQAFKKGRVDVTMFLQTDTQIHESIDLSFMSVVNYYRFLSQIKILTGQKLDI
ncbi:MAG: TolC family protein [Bdellovibrionales bacterium]|nr:TolC family protein [Bdellovibrionales bacterium]